MKFTNKLYFRITAVLLLLLILPFYLILQLTQTSYRSYIEQELSERTISTISKGEEDIRAAFQCMAAATNVFCADERLIEALAGEEVSYFNRTLAFDNVVQNIITTNLFQIRDLHFLLVDREGRLYFDRTLEGIDAASPSVRQLIEAGKEEGSSLSWSLSSLIQLKKQEEKFISVSRALRKDGISGEYLGTLIVSMDQSEVGNILSAYRVGSRDFVYLCKADDGEIIFYLDEEHLVLPEEIQRIARKIRGKDGYELQNYSDQKYIMSYYQMYRPWGFSGEDMYVLYFTEYTPIVQTFTVFAGRLNGILLFFIGALVVVVAIYSAFLTKPVIRLEKCMELYSETQEVTAVNLKRGDEIGNLSRTFYHMELKINDLFQQLRRETEVKERYRYQALRAQINPHFLFNTLNTIRWMAIIRKADNITEMVDALGSILRYSMEREGEWISLDEELEMIRKYVFIQNYRYGKECQLVIEVPPEHLSRRIIKFILQPVVENSFLHAFRHFEGEPRIVVRSQMRADGFYIRVEDNGTGIDPGPDVQQKKVTGIGLMNVEERIQIEYGEVYGIRIEQPESGGTAVEYRLPVQEQMGENHEKGLDR